MDPQKLSAQELVRLCLESGDQAMWTEFVRRFEPLIKGVVGKMLWHRGKFNCALADDLIQDAFLKICDKNYKALRKFEFRHEKALHRFLKVITMNTVEDYLRSRRNKKRNQGREEADLEQIQDTVPADCSHSRKIEQTLQCNQIFQCLEKHASEAHFARDYSIFCLYYRDGLTAKAISDLPGIGLGVKGVESALLRLIRIIRGELGK
jgi:RNA polymerase sigma-70 factor (ECF subfamily)